MNIGYRNRDAPTGNPWFYAPTKTIFSINDERI